MPKWKFWESSSPRPSMEAGSINGWGVKESDQGVVPSSQQYTPRLAHPANMNNYHKWTRDPEVNVALNVLTDISVGVGFYTEKGKNKDKIDEYCKKINLSEDLAQITWTMLAKGFCPVQRLSDYDLKPLPPENFYIYRDVYGKVLKYTQEFFPNNPVSTWEGNEMDDIILFKHRETNNDPYGRSILDPIGPLLDIRNQMVVDIGKVLHRLGFPVPVLRTSRDKANLEAAIKDREPEEWIVVGNAMKDEFELFSIETTSGGGRAPEKWLDGVNMLICEGLHAPLLLYLKNATEASATVMMESVDRLVNGIQSYMKWRVEKFLFEPQCGEPVPNLVWGAPKTGMEKITMTELANLLNSPNVANNQKQVLVKQFFPNLPEADWKSEGPPQPFMAPNNPFQANQPFQKPNQPFQKPEPKIPNEQLIEKINDLGTALEIIETNFREGRLSLTDTQKMADYTIEVHMRRMHSDEAVCEVKRQEEYDKWTRRLLKLKGD